MTLADWITATQWFFLLYFVGINSGYLLLNLMSFRSIKRYVEAHSLDDLPHYYSEFDLPVSLLVPAYNEEATIAASVRSMLQLNYAEYEVVVINDGSRDDTLAALKREFALVPFPEAYWERVPAKPVRGVYRSTIERLDGALAGLIAFHLVVNAQRLDDLVADPHMRRQRGQRILKDHRNPGTANRI